MDFVGPLPHPKLARMSRSVSGAPTTMFSELLKLAGQGASKATFLPKQLKKL